jgi:hypothetical protein
METEKYTDEELALIEYLKNEGYYDFRKVPNKGVCCLRKFLFTTGIMVGLNYDYYDGRYCYSNEHEASEELKKWDGIGDPKGNWLKYKGEGGERENLGCEMCKIKN